MKSEIFLQMVPFWMIAEETIFLFGWFMSQQSICDVILTCTS